MSLSAVSWGINNFTPIDTVNSELDLIIVLVKQWQLDLLPFKYFFNSNYNQQTNQYNYNSKAIITTQQLLLE